MKNITKLTLDNVRVIEQNNQVTYYRPAKDCPLTVAANVDGMFIDNERQVWVTTLKLDRKQIDELAQEVCHLQRRYDNHRKELREGSLLYSCDVKSFAWIAAFSLLVFEVLAWVLVAAENHGYWTAHGYAFAFIAAINLAARFVAVPMIDAWHNWRDRVDSQL